jgi:anhydro-N-acetylmuramic acid kinase
MRDNKLPCAIVNCGGIANITVIPSESALALMGFDTGPGNGLLDRFVRDRTQGQEMYDQDGRYALQGQVDLEVIQALYERGVIKNHQNFFAMQPPKSLDTGDLKSIPELERLSLEDGCATLAFFTGESIVKSFAWIKNQIPLPRQWILAGGGWYHPMIRTIFETQVKRDYGADILIQTADEVGWSTQAMEAELIAYLAVRSLRGIPLSFPKTTRVSRPMCGGKRLLPQQDLL